MFNLSQFNVKPAVMNGSKITSSMNCKIIIYYFMVVLGVLYSDPYWVIYCKIDLYRKEKMLLCQHNDNKKLKKLIYRMNTVKRILLFFLLFTYCVPNTGAIFDIHSTCTVCIFLPTIKLYLRLIYKAYFTVKWLYAWL